MGINSGDNRRDKKNAGLESSDPNRYSQPRLPGSVVGEASMPGGRKADKITKVSVLLVTRAAEEILALP